LVALLSSLEGLNTFIIDFPSVKTLGYFLGNRRASPLQPAARALPFVQCPHFFCNAAFLFPLEGSETNSFNPNEASTKQPTLENQNRDMKTISLIAAMFLTAALSGPAAEAGRIPFDGTIEGSEIHHLFGVPPFMFYVNGSGTATATQLGPFTLVYAGMVDFATRGGNGVTRL
jgi:hypothetical protein